MFGKCQFNCRPKTDYLQWRSHGLFPTLPSVEVMLCACIRAVLSSNLGQVIDHPEFYRDFPILSRRTPEQSHLFINLYLLTIHSHLTISFNALTWPVEAASLNNPQLKSIQANEGTVHNKSAIDVYHPQPPRNINPSTWHNNRELTLLPDERTLWTGSNSLCQTNSYSPCPCDFACTTFTLIPFRNDALIFAVRCAKETIMCWTTF
jgi:hypothetical protein